MSLNVKKIRQQFPILSRKVRGQALIYLDNAATTHKPKAVIETTSQYYKQENANVHRGIHFLSELATQKYEESRAKIAKFINASKPEEIVFVRNATEGINLVAQTWGRANIKKGDSILLTDMEHHSNLLPWQTLAEEKGAHLRFLGFDQNGQLELGKLDQMLKGTKFVAITAMSNVLGTINPIKEIIKKAHKHGALVLVDGAQAVANLPTDVKALDADFLAFSGHKMCGPTGIGVLYGKYELLEAMPAFLYGGEMVKTVERSSIVLNDLPYKFEAGTPNIAGAIGLGAAVDFLNGVGMKNIRQYEESLIKYAMTQLGAIKGVKIHGPLNPAKRGGAISFSVEGIHPHDLATILDEKGIAIRAGHHCAMPLHLRLSQIATARASLYFYNTRQEIDSLVNAVKYAQRLFKK